MAAGSKNQIGVRGEELACAELEQQGLQVIERNWRCRLGDPEMSASTPIDARVTAWHRRRGSNNIRLRQRHRCRRGGSDRADAGLLRGEVPKWARLRPSPGGDHVREDADAATAGRVVDARAPDQSVDHPAGCHWRRIGTGPRALAHPCTSGGLNGVGLRMVCSACWARRSDRRSGGRHRCRLATYSARRAS